jgi:hypothetical protein
MRHPQTVLVAYVLPFAAVLAVAYCYAHTR